MAGPAPSIPPHPDVAAALKDCRRAFWSVAVFSGGVNLLMLAGPLYMLQIYDRVLASRSVPTLIALTLFLVGAYAFQAALDIVRSRIVVRSAALLDSHLDRTVHAAVVRIASQSRNAGDGLQPVRDIDQIRAFLTGSGPVAIVDLPWTPFFLAVCYLINPWLGHVALVGAAILLAITVLTERSSRAPARELAQHAALRGSMVEADRRNAESILAMGMARSLGQRWIGVNKRYIGAMSRSSDVAGTFGSLSKVVRLLLQSAILGLGAYLVIQGEMTAGSMIAASIMMGRALAPIETAIANWRTFVGARQGVRRLSDTLARVGAKRAETELPGPTKSYEVERLTVAAPGTQTLIVRDVQFRLNAGEALGIVGPSGAGKTSLLRALIGVWPAARGTVRLDGATPDQWDREALGRHIGFVSQGIDLFDGTIAENIARMSPEPDNEAVLEAARAAGAHDMILLMPAGYDTRIGESGAALSAGQRQRIALARALYGKPFLIVLDEPHANLDADGEAALSRALLAAKARSAIIIIVAHRPSALSVCDKVLFLINGVQQAFGPRDEVLKKIMAPAPQLPPSPSNLKVVRDMPSGTDR